jgi:transcriptional regulator with XRE-family HTH domain
MDKTTQTNFNAISEVSDSWKIPLKDRFRFLLLCRGMSANQLADEIGINKGTLSKVINGWWCPTAKLKIIISQKLGVDSLVLFGDMQYFLDYQKTIKTKKEQSVNSDCLNIQNGN